MKYNKQGGWNKRSLYSRNLQFNKQWARWQTIHWKLTTGKLQVAETKVVWSTVKNFNTESNINTKPLNENRFSRPKGRVYKTWFSGRGFESIYGSLMRRQEKLNCQYDIQLAVTKTRLFVDTLSRNVIWHDENSIFGVDSASYPVAFMLHDCITCDIHMTLLWWMSVAKSRYQFINSSWGFLVMVTP